MRETMRGPSQGACGRPLGTMAPPWTYLHPVVVAAVALILVPSSVFSGFLLTLPKQLDPGTRERLTLTVLDPFPSPAQVRVVLKDPEEERIWGETSETLNGQGQRFTLWLRVPPLPRDATDGRVEVSVDNVTTVTRDIKFRHRQTVVFVSTDKPIYTPGQTVEIRAIAVDSRLKPLDSSLVGDVWVTDPRNNRVAQWKNISFSDGLVHLKVPLDLESPLGRWGVSIVVGDAMQVIHVEVLEYVLPKFDVVIQPPSSERAMERHLNWTICAKYTYGRPVPGAVFLRASTRSYYTHSKAMPEQSISAHLQHDGCFHYVLDTFQLEIYNVEMDEDSDTLWSSPRRGRRDPVVLFAEVTEKGTGVKRNATFELARNFMRPSLQISVPSYVSSHIKPGLPYYGEFLVETPPGEDAPKEVKVCLETTMELWSSKRWRTEEQGPYCQSVAVGPQGAVRYSLPPFPAEVAEVIAEAKIPGSGSVDSRSVQLTPWYSPSGSFLQLRLAGGPPTCDGRLAFHVDYTAPSRQPIRLYYTVVSRGDVVEEGEHLLIPTNIIGADEKESGDDGYQPIDVPFERDQCTEGGVWMNKAPVSQQRGRATLTLSSRTPDLAPRARLLAFYVRPDGEVVADAAVVDLAPCMATRVRLGFEEPTVRPGAMATVLLQGHPESLCSVASVDRSVSLLRKEERLTQEKIVERLMGLDLTDYDQPFVTTADSYYCKKDSNPDLETEGESKADIPPSPSLEPSNYKDSATAFEESGIMALTDSPRIELRPCRPARRIHASPFVTTQAVAGYSDHLTRLHSSPNYATFSSLRRGRPPPMLTPSVKIRTHFPDTWLWTLVKLGPDGKANLTVPAPHTITEWKSQAVCVGGPGGSLALSSTESLKTFQPFFLSLTLPYSVVRGETVPLIVTVLSYLEDGCLPVRVMLKSSPGFLSLNSTEAERCICEGRATVQFPIKPVSLGTLNITVHATTDPAAGICSAQGDSSVAVEPVADAIIRPLKIKAEGVEVEKTTSQFFCLNGTDNSTTFQRKVPLKLPGDVVEGSARYLISTSGDVMGPALENLDHLLRLPRGCGEQNMALLVPNLVVLDYLNTTGKISPKLRQKALDNLRKGYQRQQAYLRSDGSYSTFGNRDKTGSAWLTAFVVRTLGALQDRVPVDRFSLSSSRRWLESLQKEDGCFPLVGVVHNSRMKGGMAVHNSSAALTAYITISLLQAQLEGSTPSAIPRAVACLLSADPQPDNYTLAMTSYALALAGSPEAESYLDELIERATLKGGEMYWNSSQLPVDIETAAYAVLALLAHEGGREELAGPIVRWLSAQRNSYGGFVSTQDTVVGLEALSRYGQYVARWGPPQMTLAYSEHSDSGVTTTIAQAELTPDTRLLTMTTRHPIADSSEVKDVEVVAKGAGCALVQVALLYNQHSAERSHGLELELEQKGSCQHRLLYFCIRDTLSSPTNMIVMEIHMVSGYVPNEDSIELLYNQVELELKRYEIEKEKINLYFSKLDAREKKCFILEVQQEIAVRETKPAEATVYDYYAPERKMTVLYNVGDDCQD